MKLETTLPGTEGSRREAMLRDYSAALGTPFRNDPNQSVLALFAGGFVLIPYFWTVATTTRRVADLQLLARSTRGREPVSPVVAVLLSILGGAHMVYLQRSLNEIWDAEAAAVPHPFAEELALLAARPAS